MDKEGWIKLYRKIEDNWVYKAKPFDKFHAWMDMLLIAERTTHKSMWRGSAATFKRGDVCLSIERLAERWGWSRKKTRHFLEQLESDGMVKVNAHQNRTTVTIVNYGFYQDKGTPKGTPKGTSKDTSDGIVKGTSEDTSEDTYYKNIKEDIEEEKKKEEPSADFSSDEEEEDEGEDRWYTGAELLEMSRKGLI